MPDDAADARAWYLLPRTQLMYRTFVSIRLGLQRVGSRSVYICGAHDRHHQYSTFAFAARVLLNMMNV